MILKSDCKNTSQTFLNTTILTQNVIYEPISETQHILNSNISNEWCKIDNNSTNFLKISIDNN